MFFLLESRPTTPPLRSLPQAEVTTMFDSGILGPAKGLFRDNNHLYLTSNESTVPPHRWSELARRVVIPGNGVMISIAGGMDSALDLYSNTKPQGVAEENENDDRTLVLFDINQTQLNRIARWKLDLISGNRSTLGFIAEFFPMDVELASIIRTVEASADKEFLYWMGQIFLSVMDQAVTDKTFDSIRAGMRRLGYSPQDKALLMRYIKRSPQMMVNHEGKFERSYAGSFWSWLSNYLIYEDSRSSSWLFSSNYSMVHTAANEGRIKRVVYPLQTIVESPLVSRIVQDGTPIYAFNFSNAVQYLSENDFELLMRQMRQLPGAENILIQYFVCGYETLGKVITLTEVEDHATEMLSRNLFAGVSPDFPR